MKTLAVAWLACMLALAAFGQGTVDKAPENQASLCEVAHNPGEFEGDLFTVRGRYNSHWEWGAWIGEERCDKSLIVVLANGYSTPSYLSNLYISDDVAFH